MLKQREDEAREVLQTIRRPAPSASNDHRFESFDLDQRVDDELRTVTEAAAAEADHINAWQILFEPTLRKQLFLGCFLQAMQQLAGRNPFTSLVCGRVR